MLSRYATDAMAAIWSDEAKYARWRQVEIAVIEARVAVGLTSAEVLAAVLETQAPTVAEVTAVEEQVRHDVLAFLYAWTDQMDPAIAAHIHRDLTSSDVVDTAQAVALGTATELIVERARRLIVSLADKALEHRATLCVARTHGQPAALDVVGHRFVDFALAMERSVARLEATRQQMMVANLSGPVGTGIGLPVELASRAAQSLGLALPEVTTQVVFRDVIAAWIADLAVLGATCEAVATDVRIGQHDGVAEMAEPRKAGQEGSSAMPHKRNPVGAENIVGIARLLRGYVQPALESIALWQHRDISHSSVERVVLPDAAALAEHIVNATVCVVDGLHIDQDMLAANIDRAGAQLVSSKLLNRQLNVGAPRREAIVRVREQVESNTVGMAELQAAADEVLASERLALAFASVSDLRERHAAVIKNGRSQ
jgi:adenylosuccinate lyase